MYVKYGQNAFSDGCSLPGRRVHSLGWFGTILLLSAPLVSAMAYAAQTGTFSSDHPLPGVVHAVDAAI